MILHITIKAIKNFRSELNSLFNELKVSNGSSLIEDVIIPFQKMYLQKEKSVLDVVIGGSLNNQVIQLNKVKLSDVNFEFEKNFFDKININQLIVGNNNENNEKEKFFKLKMLLDPALYDSLISYTDKLFQRCYEIPLEEDISKTVKLLVTEYLDHINNYFTGRLLNYHTLHI